MIFESQFTLRYDLFMLLDYLRLREFLVSFGSLIVSRRKQGQWVRKNS